MKRILIGAVLPLVLMGTNHQLGTMLPYGDNTAEGFQAGASGTDQQIVALPSPQNVPTLNLSVHTLELAQTAILGGVGNGDLSEDKLIVDSLETEVSQPQQAQPAITYYNVPLTREQQEFVTALCEQYNVDVKTVYGVMYVESKFNPSARNGRCYGLMQIARINHKTLKKELGISNFLDFEDNATAGVYMLSDLYGRYRSYHKALMAYNMGETGARKYFVKGIKKTSYSNKVMRYAKSFKEISLQELLQRDAEQ